MSDILDRLAEAQSAPRDYFGPLDSLIEDNKARAGIGQHRDSDALERSNFQVIYDDLVTRFPDDVEIDRSSHWAVGWHEVILVTALDSKRTFDDSLPVWNGNYPINESDIHPAFLAAMEWQDKLDNYPVADESHYSDLEFEEFSEWVEGDASWYFNHYCDTNNLEIPMSEDFSSKLLSVLCEDCSRPDDVSDSMMNNAISEVISAELDEYARELSGIHPDQLAIDIDMDPSGEMSPWS